MSKYILPTFTVCIVAISIAITLSFTTVARANPSGIIRVATATATTSPNIFAAGTGTTTLIMDTQADGAAVADSAILNVQWTGSSTSATIDAVVEYSDGLLINGRVVDCTLDTTSSQACDWSQDAMISNVGATTSPAVTIYGSSKYRFTSASTTIGAQSTSSPTMNRTVLIPTPMRYARVVFTSPLGSTAGLLWAQMIGKKQNR